ncbi:zinc ribbon domain-containing protein [Lactobacillus taiwanensis]|uniref:zinc ribbon domain-containing protein n=1 Tax=Lactobacillus taiwanensis TaxID=508451 RepID=UPI001AEBF839|nr:zinc-ribbon domain-containing protein [Lactobacillus taiwanensis]QTQ40503.1 zinc-ribbon domain-containing protein [Lactobacillus taiwanensis]
MEKFCPNCGKEIKGEADFCPNCGYKLKKEKISKPSQPIIQKNGDETRSQIRHSKKKPMSKRNKIILSIVGVLAVLFVCFYAWGSSYYSEHNQVRRIVSALKDPNKKVSQYITSTDPDLKVTDENVKPLQRYYSNHKTQADNAIYAFEHQTDSYGVNFEQTGRYFLLFPKYKLQVPAFTPTVRTNHSNSEVKMDGKNIGKLTGSASDYSKKLEPILPGQYDFSIKSTVQGRKLSTTAETDIWSNKTVNLNIKTETLEIKSLPNGIVYINDKKVGTLNSKGKLLLKEYPISGNMNLYVRATVNNRTIQSKTIDNLSEGLDYASDGTDTISTDGNKYVIKPEWKGLVNKDDAKSVLSDAFDIPDPDQFVDGSDNSDYVEMKKMIDSYKDQDDISNIESEVSVQSITPYDNNSSEVTYSVKWTFVHDDYDRVQVMQYTNAVLTNEKNESGAKIKKIGTGKLTKDHKVTTGDSSSDTDTNSDSDSDNDD